MTAELIACYWTIAGPVVFGPDDHSERDFRDRAEAVGRAGYRGIGIKHADLMRTQARYGWDGLKALLADNGLIHLEVEALTDWWAEGAARRESDRVRDDLFDAAARLGARHVKVYGAIPTEGPQSADALRPAFATIAARAREAGTVAALEPIACSGIPDLDTALAIIGDDLGKGGGLMLDAWHIVRGGLPLDRIAALPPGAIAGVELDDGALTGEDYLIDTMNRRLLPGEGAFDLAAVIAAVRAAGHDGPWGVEICSETIRAMALEESAEASYAATARLFAD